MAEPKRKDDESNVGDLDGKFMSQLSEYRKQKKYDHLTKNQVIGKLKTPISEYGLPPTTTTPPLKKAPPAKTQNLKKAPADYDYEYSSESDKSENENYEQVEKKYSPPKAKEAHDIIEGARKRNKADKYLPTEDEIRKPDPVKREKLADTMQIPKISKEERIANYTNCYFALKLECGVTVNLYDFMYKYMRHLSFGNGKFVFINDSGDSFITSQADIDNTLTVFSSL